MARKAIPAFETEKGVFPVRLKELMEQAPKTSQKMLADVLGVTRQAVANYQCGQSSPSWDAIAKIAKHFNVSSDYLLGLSDVRTPETELRTVCEYTGLSENAISSLIHINSLDEKRKAEDRIFIANIISQMLSDGAFYVLVMQIQALHEAYKVFQSEEFIAPDEEKRELAAAEANRIMGFPVNIITGKERLELFKNNISRNSVHIAEKIVESMLKEDDAIKEKAIEMLRNGGDT